MNKMKSLMKRLVCAMLAMLMVFTSVSFDLVKSEAAEKSDITIYFDNSYTKWNGVKLHYWGDGSTTWPGIDMEKTTVISPDIPSGDNTYKLEVPAGITGIVFNSTDENGNEVKSADVTDIEDGAVYVGVAYQNNKYVVLKKNADGTVKGEPTESTEEDKLAKQVNVNVGEDYSKAYISYTTLGKTDSKVILTNTKTKEQTVAIGTNYYSYLTGKYMHRVVVEGLNAGTKYTYNIGSGIYKFYGSFTTLPEEGSKATAKFAYIADPQIQTAETSEAFGATCSELNKYNDLGFIYMAGDITDNAENTEQWNGLFKNNGSFKNASQKLFANNLIAVTQGNHDKNFDKSTLSDYINTPAEAGNLVYSFDYGTVKMIILNLETAKNNEEVMQEQKAFLEKEVAVAKAANQWTVVGFHKSIYTGASHIVDSDVKAARKYWGPILAQLDVDLVLQGHDHVYSRGFIEADGSDAQMETTEDGAYVSKENTPLYVVGGHAGGLKWYSQKSYPVEDGDPLLPNYAFLDKNSTDDGSDVKKEQVYTIFEVTEDTLTSTTYMMKYDSETDKITTQPYVYDTYKITKANSEITKEPTKIPSVTVAPSVEPTKAAEKVDIAKASVSKVKDVVYTGKAVKPTVKITYNGANLTLNKDYKVSYNSNKEIGKASITVTGLGSYTGTSKASFNILPKKISVKKVTSSAANKAEVSWKKTSGKISGYEVVYSSSKTFKAAKKKTTKSTSITLKSLKSKKTYYVKVRAYKTVSGEKIYGSYSKTVKVKVK